MPTKCEGQLCKTNIGGVSGYIVCHAGKKDSIYPTLKPFSVKSIMIGIMFLILYDNFVSSNNTTHYIAMAYLVNSQLTTYFLSPLTTVTTLPTQP